MGLCCKITLLLIPIVVGFVYLRLIQTDPVPNVEDEFWGPKANLGKKEDTSIRPFQIEIPASVIEDLRTRLKLELGSDRLIPPLEGIGFEYGFNTKYLQTVGQYWLAKYDWKARETLLNKFPQFKTSIAGLDIHFYHVKPTKKAGVETRPLLLLHGWPGSVVEYQKIIPLLSEPKNSKFNYEVIVPSLPGYGFSDGAARPGLSSTEMANIFKRLMNRLGHDKFFAMGGDWGAVIVSDLATVYPSSVLGVHATMCPARLGISHVKAFLASALPSVFTSPEETKSGRSFGETFSFLMRESGYFHLQATKPDTVGVGLSHSPMGLAAYILEKFSTWTNRNWISREDGGLVENFTLDELLDNIMVYWVTGSITTSARLYSENYAASKKHKLDRVPTNVPYDCQFLPEDLLMPSKIALEDKFTNLRRYSVASRGGHFGAFEAPEVVADDAVSFFNSL